MKRTLLFILTLATFSVEGQDIVISNFFFGETELIQTTRHFRKVELGTYSYTDSEKILILEKQYLSPTYDPSVIDDFALEADLRFNAYNGQMEFAKDGMIYYLKKEEGRTVDFEDAKYKVYNLFGSLEFLVVELEGKNSLLSFQSSDFILPKRRATTYGYHVRANFRRNTDEFFLALEDDQLIKIPRQKREFYAVFGSNAKSIKNFVKKNKLSITNRNDLKEIVQFSNEL